MEYVVLLSCCNDYLLVCHLIENRSVYKIYLHQTQYNFTSDQIKYLKSCSKVIIWPREDLAMRQDEYGLMSSSDVAYFLTLREVDMVESQSLWISNNRAINALSSRNIKNAVVAQEDLITFLKEKHRSTRRILHLVCKGTVRSDLSSFILYLKRYYVNIDEHALFHIYMEYPMTMSDRLLVLANTYGRVIFTNQTPPANAITINLEEIDVLCETNGQIAQCNQSLLSRSFGHKVLRINYPFIGQDMITLALIIIQLQSRNKIGSILLDDSPYVTYLMRHVTVKGKPLYSIFMEYGVTFLSESNNIDVPYSYETYFRTQDHTMILNSALALLAVTNCLHLIKQIWPSIHQKSKVLSESNAHLYNQQLITSYWYVGNKKWYQI